MVGVHATLWTPNVHKSVVSFKASPSEERYFLRLGDLIAVVIYRIMVAIANSSIVLVLLLSSAAPNGCCPRVRVVLSSRSRRRRRNGPIDLVDGGSLPIVWLPKVLSIRWGNLNEVASSRFGLSLL